mmetsp:Transcript_20440/g.40877  ORF Transcript_20440/g.40877 Transcript_20440/m.40877 type:complete len:262 (-) Transcript_20440:141-926(-)
MPTSTAVLAHLTPIGPFLEISVAILRALSNAPPASTAWLTMPYCAASEAPILRAVNMSSLARAEPMRRGSRCVPPAPGMMAREVSGRPKRASAPATLMSHERAISRPPPSAAPSTAAMVGSGRLESAVKVLRRELTNVDASSWLMVLRSLRSAPAQKTRSTSLVRMTARRLGSAGMLEIASASSPSICLPSAFRAEGLDIRSTAIWAGFSGSEGKADNFSNTKSGEEEALPLKAREIRERVGTVSRRLLLKASMLTTSSSK